MIVGTEYFPESILVRLGLLDIPSNEEVEEEIVEQPWQEDEEEFEEQEIEREQPSRSYLLLRFLGIDSRPLVSALVRLNLQEYFTDRNGEIKVFGLEKGKDYDVRIEHEGVDYKTRIMGTSIEQGEFEIRLTQEDITNETDWMRILMYVGGGIVLIILCIVVIKAIRPKE